MPQGLRALLNGSFWLVLASGLSQGSMLVASLLIANLLGVASYGRYALLQSTILLLAGLAQISFTVVIAQQVASFRERNAGLAGEIATFCFLVTILLSLAFAVGLMAGRDFISLVMFRDPELASGLAAGALAVPWVAAAAVQQGLFSGLERFRDQAVIAVLLTPFVIALPTLGALHGGFEGAVVGLALAYFLRFAVAQILLIRLFRREGLRWQWGRLRPKLKLISRFALPGTLAGLATSIAIWGGQTLLVRSDGGVTMLGMFAAAYIVETIVMFIPTQVVFALLPVLSRVHALPDSDDPRKLLWINAAASFLFTATLAGMGIIAAPLIMGFFGDDFRTGSDILVILLLAAPIKAVAITLYQDLQARGLFWKGLLSTILPWASTAFFLAAALIPSFDARGLATAWLVGWLVALLGTMLARRRILDDTSGDKC